MGFWNEVRIGSSGFLPLPPIQELAECDFPFANLRLWTEWFSLLATVFGLVSIQLFKKAHCGCCFGRVAGQTEPRAEPVIWKKQAPKISAPCV